MSSTHDSTQPEFWNEKWQRNDTPWDKSTSHPLLSHLVQQQSIFFHQQGKTAESVSQLDENHLKQLKVKLAEDTKKIKLAMVPGCGTGKDVGTLAKLSNVDKVIGVDLSEIATEKATELHVKEAKEGKVEFLATDFFKLHERFGGQVDLIWDYTFLCALHPSMRGDWASEMIKLVRQGGYLLTMVFPIKQYSSDPNSPPYPFTVSTVKELLGDSFELVHDEKVVDSQSFTHEKREGFEWYALWRRQ
eukprot:CAMPEP_0117442252 /NCGR_PEP_ID=MMETSP0759-20121206/4055_1 /TAXON_ID=63605 /ORGANISM="Percolomonas cosmopolitus, Strain WS" /LENGTH=245 /DNA_ID=CAMNT_0005234133 /DNA_START=25 /DNA_END=762 /DNA_ORIENTATION=+